MSLAKFFERYGGGAAANVVALPESAAAHRFSIAPISAGMRVRLDDDVGAVEWIDRDRIVWRDDKGAVHFTLSHYLERA